MTRWNRFWFTPGDASALGACRLWFFGALFLWMLPRDFAVWGEFSSVFWMPVGFFDALGVPAFSAATLGVMQFLWKASLLLAAIGLLTRPAMCTAAILGTYLVLLPENFGHVQYADTLVLLGMWAFVVSRAGDAISVDAIIRGVRAGNTQSPPPSGEYTWPIRFMWVATALAVGAASVSSLLHSGFDSVIADAWLAPFIICSAFWVPWTAVGRVVRARLRGDVESERLVLYDASCVLCSRSAVVLARLDILRRIRFADQASAWPWLAGEFPSLDRLACNAEFHVVTGDGRVFGGFDACRAIASVLPVGWLVCPLMSVPPVPKFGRRWYRALAATRHALNRRLSTPCT